MASYIRTQKLGLVPYSAGGRSTIEIDRAGVLLGLDLRLRYSLVDGGTDATGAMFQTIARMIKRVELIVGGRDTIWNISGAALAANVNYTQGQACQGMGDTAIPTGGATNAFDLHLPIDLMLIDGYMQDDTALDLRKTSQMTLAITFNDTNLADLFTAPGGTTLTFGSLYVQGRYLITDDVTKVYGARTLTSIDQPIGATSDNFEIVIDRQSGLFVRSLMLIALEAQVGTNAIINNVKLKSGTTVFHETTAADLRARNKRELKLDNLITGVLYLPEHFLGKGLTMLNTSQNVMGADLKLELDVTAGAASRVIVVTEGLRGLTLG